MKKGTVKLGNYTLTTCSPVNLAWLLPLLLASLMALHVSQRDQRETADKAPCQQTYASGDQFPCTGCTTRNADGDCVPIENCAVPTEEQLISRRYTTQDRADACYQRGGEFCVGVPGQHHQHSGEV